MFLVNQLGVFIAGIFAFQHKSTASHKHFWITGFAGGFTTMSSLAFILHESSVQSASLYATASLLTSYALLKILKLRVPQ